MCTAHINHFWFAEILEHYSNTALTRTWGPDLALYEHEANNVVARYGTRKLLTAPLNSPNIRLNTLESIPHQFQHNTVEWSLINARKQEATVLSSACEVHTNMDSVNFVESAFGREVYELSQKQKECSHTLSSVPESPAISVPTQSFSAGPSRWGCFEGEWGEYWWSSTTYSTEIHYNKLTFTLVRSRSNM